MVVSRRLVLVIRMLTSVPPAGRSGSRGLYQSFDLRVGLRNPVLIPFSLLGTIFLVALLSHNVYAATPVDKFYKTSGRSSSSQRRLDAP